MFYFSPWSGDLAPPSDLHSTGVTPNDEIDNINRNDNLTENDLLLIYESENQEHMGIFQMFFILYYSGP